MFIIHTFQFYATLEKKYFLDFNGMIHNAVCCVSCEIICEKNTEARLKIPQIKNFVIFESKLWEEDLRENPFAVSLLLIYIYEKLASLES